jgi:hypothetical protein
MPDWCCGRCGAWNAEDALVCELCLGKEHVISLPGPPTPLHRVFDDAAAILRSWNQPCSEPGCTKTAGEHRDELKQLLLDILAKRHVPKRSYQAGEEPQP